MRTVILLITAAIMTAAYDLKPHGEVVQSSGDYRLFGKTDDDKMIYREALRTMRDGKTNGTGHKVEQSVIRTEYDDFFIWGYYLLYDKKYGLDSVMIKDFENMIFYALTKEQHSRYLNEVLEGEQNIVLLSENEFSKFFGKKFRKKFYRQYPHSNGYCSISPITYNYERNVALLFYEATAHYLVGVSYFIICIKSDGKWIVKDIIMCMQS
jgi:hypothetical protein